jgi:TPP-dependent pyruvate/acetoin dehydrogenase alpha subunit
MHLIDVHAGAMGASAVVATTIPNAAGYAYAMKLKRKPTIVVSFFGDGAVDEGVFHETMNFATLKALPIIFICENNSYAIHTHQLRRQALGNICDKARSYGMNATQIPDNDIFSIHEQVSAAASRLRTGGAGPVFFECLTYRLKEHVGPNDDYQLGYRTRAEAEPWIRNDPVTQLAARVEPARRKLIEAAVEAEIREAFDFAEASAFPPAEELFTDVYGS